MNKEVNQHGAVVKLKKIEIAKEETRIYVSVTNQSKDKFNFYQFNTKMVMNNKQFEIEDNFEANYPEVQIEILSGVTSEGIISFPALGVETGTIKVLLEGQSENYMVDFKPYGFTVSF
ncbi:hypothetical protein [Tepidibacillus marianensis]|uniref:hypothetical protein n=1 Tax=Tepidibacillus marianensis TaxID=3131995 RepID=UPI0030D23FBE